MVHSKIIVLIYLATMLCDKASSCMYSAGARFKEFGSMRLSGIAFQTRTVITELECILTCKSQTKCLSLNLLTGNNKMACELLDVDSRSFPMIPSNNFTYFEKETVSIVAFIIPGEPEKSSHF